MCGQAVNEGRPIVAEAAEVPRTGVTLPGVDALYMTVGTREVVTPQRVTGVDVHASALDVLWEAVGAREAM